MIRRSQGHDLPAEDLLDHLLQDPAGTFDRPSRPPEDIARQPADPGVTRRLGVVLSVVSIALGLSLAGSIGWFYWRSHSVGDALTSQEREAMASSDASCGAPAPLSGALQVEGLLQASSIGLTAPVVQGTGNAQLDVAVGHDPGSAWPGTSGTMVLAAHDVTWFSEIDHLRRGDSVTFTEACKIFRYQVTGAQVVRTGSPIQSTDTSTLALVTCYPLNALFLTSQRYVLDARLVSATQTRAAPPTVATLSPAPTVSVPAPLAAQDLSLQNNPVPLGTLDLTGSPSSAWQESPRPIQVEASVLELYFGALRSAQQDQTGWWNQLAPGVPFSAAAALNGASLVGNGAEVIPTLDVDGTKVTGATLTADPELEGANAPGTYEVTMKVTVRGNDLVITGWQMEQSG